jgi:hypothetical protein
MVRSRGYIEVIVVRRTTFAIGRKKEIKKATVDRERIAAQRKSSAAS